MHIPIHIPIGVKYVAGVQGAVWKIVCCAHCQQRYAYLLELEATGEHHDLLFVDGEASAQRAQAKAQENLLLKSRNVVLAVPCPGCGFYQDDMSAMLKEQRSINALQIAGVVMAGLALVPLAFDVRYIWVLSIVLGVAGLALLARGYALALGYDPNAGDPEPRKALRRAHAVWGQQLEESLAADAAGAVRPPAGTDDEPDRGGIQDLSSRDRSGSSHEY